MGAGGAGDAEIREVRPAGGLTRCRPGGLREDGPEEQRHENGREEPATANEPSTHGDDFDAGRGASSRHCGVPPACPPRAARR